MDEEEIRTTEAYRLYLKGQDFARQRSYYSDTDKNHRFYNGFQMQGLKAGGLERVQLNYIKPIVKAKVGSITANLFTINYSSDNLEPEFVENGEQVCKLLNKYASRVFEKCKLDVLIRKVATEACVNDEAIIYAEFDKETNLPDLTFLRKNDVYYGDENNSEIQKQPYIIVKQRLPVVDVQTFARNNGVSEEEIKLIRGDKETFEEAGIDSKEEVDDRCVLITKLYKKNGKVVYDRCTKCVEIKTKVETGLSLYPIAHFIWEDRPGNARGEGVVRNQIPGQIEVNKTVIRRLLTAQNTAYPQRVVDISKIKNKKDINKAGAVIEVVGARVDDIRKVFNITSPAQMSTDVEKIQNEIIQMSRELENAGDNVTGNIDVTQTSGRAILAVQNAAREPLNEQLTYLKNFIEDLARIFFDLLTVYSKSSIALESEIDDGTGNIQRVMVDVPNLLLQALKVNVKVEISPRSSFDKYAQEQFLENLLVNGLFNPQRLPELEVYVMALDDDLNVPKQKLEKIVQTLQERKRQIEEIDSQAQLMLQNANNFLNAGVDGQADIINEASKLQEA